MKMKKAGLYIIWALLVVGILPCCTSPHQTPQGPPVIRSVDDQVPKALFVTTGVNLDNTDKNLPPDVVAALHAFNKLGVPVRLAPRDILWQPDSLIQYAYLILSTAKGVHDADRKYSLSYMTDAELENIARYVQKGGVLIAGDNIGRNDYMGLDRILKKRKLDASVYPLAPVLGYEAVETNLKNHRLTGTGKLPVETVRTGDYDLWTTVPTRPLSEHLQVLAYWTDGHDSIPAITLNRYGKGWAISLPLSGLLKPAPDGLWSMRQIHRFYAFVDSVRNPKYRIRIHPWPRKAPAALAVSFNPSDSARSYRFVLDQLQEKDIPAVFFVHGKMNDTIRRLLRKYPVGTASNGYAYAHYRNLDFSSTVNDIKLNEYVWKRSFKGFRFPYTTPTFNGLNVLQRNHYRYESSITANNLNVLRGSNVPYNLVISQGDYYVDTGLWELSPPWHDDYFFLHPLAEGGYPTPKQFEKDVQLLDQFLIDYWHYVVLPVNGLMVYIGHPMLTGHNEQTFGALQHLVDTARSRQAWLASLDEIWRYKQVLDRVKITARQQDQKIHLSFWLPENIIVPGFTLKLSFAPAGVQTSDGRKVETVTEGNHTYLIFDLQTGLDMDIQLP